MPGRALAILFVFTMCLCAAAPLAAVSPDATAAGTNAGQPPADSDGDWREARHQTDAIVTESVWKSTAIHSELARIRCRGTLIRLPTVQSRPGAYAFRHLPTSPLLI